MSATAAPAPDLDLDLLDSGEAGGAALRGGALRTGGYVLGLLLPLISAPLLIHHLGEADFGRYSAVLAVLLIVMGLTDGGIGTIALRELSATRDAVRRDRLMGDLLGLRLALATAGAALGVAFVALAGYGDRLVLGAALAGAGMLAISTQALLGTVLASRLRFGWATAIDLARQLLFTALVVVCVVAGGGVVAFLAIWIPAGLLILGLTVPLVRGSIRLRPALHPRRWARLLGETAVYAIVVAVNTVCFRVTLVIMSLVATVQQTGFFAVSFRIMEVLVGVPGLLLSAAFPIVARSAVADRPRFDASVGRLFELALLAGTGLAVGMVLAAPFAIDLLTGAAGHPSTAVLRIQSSGIAATFVVATTTYALLALHRTRGLLLGNLVALAVVVVLTLALAPGSGARGAALAAVAAEVLLATTTVTMLARDGGPALPLRAVPLTLGLGTIALAAGWATGLHPLLQATTALLLFTSLLHLTRRFPPELAEAVRRRGPRATR